MPNFDYKAYDNLGGKSEGSVEAATLAEAQVLVEQKGLLPYEIKENKALNNARLFGDKVSLADLEFITSELSLLLSTGVRIDRGLDIIRRTKAKPAVAKLLGDLSARLKKGESLSAACRAHPKVFDNLYCNLVSLGEASGDLTGIFDGLAKDLQFKRDLRKKIISAMTYPSVIFFVCLMSIFFIFNVIIPKMADMFKEIDSLPWYTQMMLSTSNWMTNNQGTLLIVLILLAILGAFAMRTPAFVKQWHQYSVRLPLVATAIKTIERIRFNSGLSLMLKAGVPIDKGLELATGNIKNSVLFNEMNVARKKIKRGEQLSVTLKQTSIYPAFYVSLLEVGEESGKLERVFEEIANRSKQEFETWTDRMTSLLEPLMILFMGVFVGGVVIIMMLSMMSLNGAAGL